MTKFRWQVGALALGWTIAVAGCGDDGKTETDAGPKADATLDATASDTATVDTAGELPKTEDTAADTGPSCGALPSCLNDKGQEDKSLCPKATATSTYTCEDGCCVAIVKCKADAECAGQLGKAACPNSAFTCGCDPDTEKCVQTMCRGDAECGADKVCLQGGCKVPPVAGDLRARLLRPNWVGGQGPEFEAAVALGAQALDDNGNVASKAEFEWTMAPSEAFTLTGGKLKPTDKAGKATVTAKVKGSSKAASNPATLWNFGTAPAAGSLRVTVLDEENWQAVAGKVVVVGLADQATPAAPQVVDLKDGQATVAGTTCPCDVHVISQTHAAVSVMRFVPPAGQGADLVLPTPLHHFAELEFDDKGVLNKDKSKLIGGDLVRGTIDYPGEGEAALGLTSLSFGPALLGFSIESILGPNVRRPFHKDAPTFVNPDPKKAQEVPGGVTFALGPPVVTHYVLAGTPGKHLMWTLAGRLSLNDVISQAGKIVGAVDGGLDVGQVVGVLLPYLAGFSSQVVYDVDFKATLTEPLHELPALKPTFPLLVKAEVQVSDLPKVGNGWADLALVLGGALLPSGELVPLGLTAGADTASGEEKADGKVDGDDQTDGNQPLNLSIAPLHSGLRFGDSNHVLVSAAIILGGKGKKEGGSLILGEPGVVPTVVKPGEWLGFPEGASYVPATGTLTPKTVAGAHVYRLSINGPEGNKWLVLVPGDQTVKLPDLTAWGAKLDLAKQAKRAYFAAFELKKAATLTELVAPGGLTDIVRLVKRTAFLDVQ